jgi:hypothetical protein
MKTVIFYILTLLIPTLVSAADIIAEGSTDVSLTIRLHDTSLAPVTGETFSTVDCFYRRDGAVVTNLTEVTGGSLTTHVDNTLTELQDGIYEYDLPDAAVASGARGLTFCCEDSDGSHTDFVMGCERVIITNATPANFEDLAITSSSGYVTVGGIAPSGAANLFTNNSGTTYGSAVAGSVVKEIADNVTATVSTINAAALADLFDTDSGTTYGSAVAGSVVKEIADNASGGGGGGTSATGSNFAATQKVTLYSDTGVTSSTVTGGYVTTPQFIGGYYLLIDATEQSAGGVTVTVVTSEINSGAGTVVHQQALTATGKTRIELEDVSGQKTLGRYLRVELSSLTGEWDANVTLEYAPVK